MQSIERFVISRALDAAAAVGFRPRRVYDHDLNVTVRTRKQVLTAVASVVESVVVLESRRNRRPLSARLNIELGKQEDCIVGYTQTPGFGAALDDAARFKANTEWLASMSFELADGLQRVLAVATPEAESDRVKFDAACRRANRALEEFRGFGSQP